MKLEQGRYLQLSNGWMLNVITKKIVPRDACSKGHIVDMDIFQIHPTGAKRFNDIKIGEWFLADGISHMVRVNNGLAADTDGNCVAFDDEKMVQTGEPLIGFTVTNEKRYRLNSIDWGMVKAYFPEMPINPSPVQVEDIKTLGARIEMMDDIFRQRLCNDLIHLRAIINRLEDS